MSGVSWLVYKFLHPAFAGFVALDMSSAGVFTRGVVLTVLSFLLADFGFFLSHYLLHRIPILWHFHEVHHSAEVLTPVSVYRVHPVEEIVNGCVGAVVGALGAATYAAIAGRDVTPFTLFGVNVFMFGFFLVAFQLRHTHVWLSYGPVLSRLFISPAQHQIHHGRDTQHWGKNYGFVLAIWDIAFRSLYVPRTRETIRFGTDTDPAHFASVPKLYFLPFVKAVREVAGWWPCLRRSRPEGKPTAVPH
jgi:sterol desaturase/sphingolipid hydroxylase (fatty acid hydroxylase superfamily)